MRIIIHGRHGENDDLRQAVETLRAAGQQVDVRVTWDPGDGTRFAREACIEKIETIVAAGGDGTVNEVLSGILSVPVGTPLPSLGIVPLGTANDFARACGLPPHPDPALQLIATAEPVPIDVGRLGPRAFINVATGGFGTQVTTETPDDLKRILGGAAYLVTGLQKFTSMTSSPGRFSGPGFSWAGNFLVLAVGNGRQAGGGQLLCPDAYIDDGLLEVTILPEIAPGELGAVLGDILQTGIGNAEFAVERVRLPWVELESDVELAINLDGESISGTSFRFEAQAKALRIHLPPDCPLLSRNAA